MVSTKVQLLWVEEKKKKNGINKAYQTPVSSLALGRGNSPLNLSVIVSDPLIGRYDKVSRNVIE